MWLKISLCKGSADHAELCANTDANHNSTIFFIFFLQISFILILTKYMFLFLRISKFYINSKN